MPPGGADRGDRAEVRRSACRQKETAQFNPVVWNGDAVGPAIPMSLASQESKSGSEPGTLVHCNTIR